MPKVWICIEQEDLISLRRLFNQDFEVREDEPESQESGIEKYLRTL